MWTAGVPDQVPVIDLQPFRTGQDSDKMRVAREVAQACSSLGFLVVSGHAVPHELVEQMYDVSRRFFDLPSETKRDLTSQGTGPGYRPPATSALARSRNEDTPPDLKEGLTISPVGASGRPYYSSVENPEWVQPNRWPDQPADLKATWVAYYRAMENLASTLMQVFALALELSEDYFDDKIDRHISHLSALNYPKQEHEPEAGQLRAGAHTDWGSLTILYKDQGSGGLQVLHPSGGWLDVDPIPGTFIVNIGDLLAEWTNDRWVSTLHRVVNPPPEKAASSRRISLVFFHQPNYDALIAPLESCVSSSRPAQYEPVTSGEHLLAKKRMALAGVPLN